MQITNHVHSFLSKWLPTISFVDEHLTNDWLVVAWMCLLGSVLWVMLATIQLARVTADDRDLFFCFLRCKLSTSVAFPSCHCKMAILFPYMFTQYFICLYSFFHLIVSPSIVYSFPQSVGCADVCSWQHVPMCRIL